MRKLFLRSSSVLALGAAALVAAPSAAQEQPSGAGPSPASGQEEGSFLAEIIVTAQKRSESSNRVPISITAESGVELAKIGVTDVQALVKVTPGFNAIDSGYGTPVYFLRGIGFFDSSLAAKPTVSVYIDEAPIPFSIMTTGASFDLERVEVLKGPQGILFGQNATGGAINYVAAKPTSDFEAGMQVGYGRFNRLDLEGYASGPVSDTLGVRLAVRHEGGDAWQKSFTRDDELGRRDFTQGRLTLAWEPDPALRVNFQLNANKDRSDTQAPQLVAPFRQSAGGYFSPALQAYPAAPENNRAADWGSTVPLRRDNHMVQGTLRLDYDISDTITVTSLSSYATFEQLYGQDGDGTSLQLTDLLISGDIDSFTQELRVAGSLMGDRGNWLLGGNYEHSKANELVRQFLSEQTSGHVFDRLGLPAITEVPQRGNTKYVSKAVFGNVAFPLADTLSATAGARYTKTDVDFQGCILNAGNGTYGKGFEANFGLPAGTFPLNACATLDATNRPAEFDGTLPEDNVSWRTGLEWAPNADHLLYGNISRGYKVGSFANLPASTLAQYQPVKQEEVTGYEIGFKSRVAGRTMQVNGALFLYDYTDKQLKGRTIVPIFGPLEAMVNVPKSQVKGAEIEVTWAPVEGLRLKGGATYLDTEVTRSFLNYTAFGAQADFKGSRFPFTPRWQGNADAEYQWPVGAGKDAFVGASYIYRSGTNGDFIPDPRLAIDSYGLLDLRVGLQDAAGDWRVSLYGRNVTNEYYYQTAVRRGDAIVRYAGMPVTYGVTASIRFH
ncbi:TonB-dependent receptor [Niveispirillum fermenti]|uniref:TonB-dependent receptor n=1 Tax=Niveispirillum fermenti TaxID=1233113 RepID=UPI003A8914BC